MSQIRTKPNNNLYRDNYDRIFRSKSLYIILRNKGTEVHKLEQKDLMMELMSREINIKDDFSGSLLVEGDISTIREVVSLFPDWRVLPPSYSED